MKITLLSYALISLLVTLFGVNCFANFDPTTGKWITRDPLGEKPDKNMTRFCNNDPVNNVDPRGLEAYVVYRQFADEDPSSQLRSRGHFFLAFDEKNIKAVEAWNTLVNKVGGYTPATPESAFYNPSWVPINKQIKEDLPNPDLETFSFHPWSVYDQEVGGAYSLFGDTGTSLDVVMTSGSYIGYGDKVDRDAFQKARDKLSNARAHNAVIFPLNLTDKQQFDLYKATIASRNINNQSPLSRDTLSYILGVFNCGTWTYTMLKRQEIPYPQGAQQYNRIPVMERIPFLRKLSAGVGVRGKADYTGIPQVSSVVLGSVGAGYKTLGLAGGATVIGSQKIGGTIWSAVENAEFIPGRDNDGDLGLLRWKW